MNLPGWLPRSRYTLPFSVCSTAPTPLSITAPPTTAPNLATVAMKGFRQRVVSHCAPPIAPVQVGSLTLLARSAPESQRPLQVSQETGGSDLWRRISLPIRLSDPIAGIICSCHAIFIAEQLE